MIKYVGNSYRESKARKVFSKNVWNIWEATIEVVLVGTRV